MSRGTETSRSSYPQRRSTGGLTTLNHLLKKLASRSKLRKMIFLDIDYDLSYRALFFWLLLLDHGRRDKSFKLNKLNVEIRQGDITQERSDVVVNSVTESLDLSKGMHFYSLMMTTVYTVAFTTIAVSFVLGYHSVS